MTIHEWMQKNGVNIRRDGMPSVLASKFELSDDAEFFANQDESCWSGLCKAKNLFAAYRSGKGIRTNQLDKPDRGLDGW